MARPLRVLFLEDRPADVELMIHQLRRGDFDVNSEVVQDRDSFIGALTNDLDIILADFSLPQYGALQALQDLKASAVDVPTIVVTGTLDDGSAVSCIKLGAADYLLKDRLARLVSAVEHALSERQGRLETEAAQRAGQQTSARLEAIFRNTQDAILLVDNAGKCLDANPAAENLTGFVRDELLTMTFSDLDADLEEPHKILGPGNHRGEHSLRRRDGGVLTTDFQSVADIIPGVSLLVLRDITERKKTDEALLSAQKLESLGVLAGGVAHDFNNLLVAVLGNADLALADLPTESPAIDAVRQIKAAARRAADLARQMLALSGRGRFVVERIHFNGLVEEMTHLLAASIERGIVIRYNLGSGLPPVEADATQLRQIVMNLVVNASDAIGKASGTITLSTGVMRVDRRYLAETFLAPDLLEGDYTYLEVADSGDGMTPETQKRIFDPFFTTKFTGRGLGLSAVLGILRAHHGAIKVYSELGKGTTFKVILPCAEPLKADAGSTVDDPTWTTKGVVLVVDDDDSVRAVTRRALERMGLSVMTAVDGREALTVYQGNPEGIDLVLLDMTMPRLSGEEVFRELRRIRADLPIIVMSGYSEQDTVDRFAGKRLSGFVQKPFEIATLRQAVRLAMQG